jgi:hypothetical protein
LFWPPTDVEIAKMLTPEALREWDFDIFRSDSVGIVCDLRDLSAISRAAGGVVLWD